MPKEAIEAGKRQLKQESWKRQLKQESQKRQLKQECPKKQLRKEFAQKKKMANTHYSDAASHIDGTFLYFNQINLFLMILV